MLPRTAICYIFRIYLLAKLHILGFFLNLVQFFVAHQITFPIKAFLARVADMRFHASVRFFVPDKAISPGKATWAALADIRSFVSVQFFVPN